MRKNWFQKIDLELFVLKQLTPWNVLAFVNWSSEQQDNIFIKSFYQQQSLPIKSVIAGFECKSTK